MTGSVDREFLARDVYPTWRRRVKAATSQVLVFTPYLDRLVVSLLSSAPLPASQMGVVTDLSPESGVRDYRKQLLAIQTLLNAGIEVRSLPRLHAKVLLVDGVAVTVGSQNFTSYARRSKEATVAAAANVSGTSFVATLRSWHLDADPVDPDLVERLLASLTGHTKAVKAAVEDLQAAFVEVEQAHRTEVEERRRAEAEEAARRQAAQEAAARAAASQAAAAAARARISRGLAHATTTTRYRSAQQTAHARMKDGHLAADSRSDLTAWKRYDGTRWQNERLTWLRYYPIIVQPSGRMAYARVAKTVITFLKSGIRWTDRRRINGRDLAVVVEFPERNLDDGNIVITLRTRHERPWGCRLRLLFDGQDCDLVRDEVFGVEHGDVVDTLRDFCVQAWDDDPDSVLHAAFDSTRFTKIGIGSPNASNYFTAADYRLNLIEYVDRPILVATPT